MTIEIVDFPIKNDKKMWFSIAKGAGTGPYLSMALDPSLGCKAKAGQETRRASGDASRDGWAFGTL